MDIASTMFSSTRLTRSCRVMPPNVQVMVYNKDNLILNLNKKDQISTIKLNRINHFDKTTITN